MRQMFLLFSHKLTTQQEKDAKESLGVEKFVALPDDLQNLWSNIPPELKELDEYLIPLKEFIKANANEGDYVLIQGDFGGCFEMVNFVKTLGLIAVHSTTKRDTVERVADGKVEKFSKFEHVIFRSY